MKIVLSSLKLEVKSNKCNSDISNYTVMLNGYSQWLNIKGIFSYQDISSIDITDAGLQL